MLRPGPLIGRLPVLVAQRFQQGAHKLAHRQHVHRGYVEDEVEVVDGGEELVEGELR